MVCKGALADPFGRASITCKAEGITAGVDVTVEWYRKRGRVSIEEDDNHRIEKSKHVGTLTILSVGEYFVIFASVVDASIRLLFRKSLVGRGGESRKQGAGVA